jgi:hypothetical protein
MMPDGCVQMEEKAVLVLAKDNVTASPFSLCIYSAGVTIYPFYPHEQPAQICAFCRVIFVG